MKNAIEAMPKGGKLVECEKTNIDLILNRNEWLSLCKAQKIKKEK
jgi:hypothetical protein